MKVRDRFKTKFHKKTFIDFKESLGELRQEMEARFNSKDEIINSIQKIAKTLQDTLQYPN
jgi:regulator of sigma D